MFTTNQFNLNPAELRVVAYESTSDSSVTKIIIAAIGRAQAAIMDQLLQSSRNEVDVLRGAALILRDIQHIMKTQISAELQRRGRPDTPVDKLYEV